MADKIESTDKHSSEDKLKPLSAMPGPAPTFIEKIFFHGSNDPDFINFLSIGPYLEYKKKYGDLVHYKIGKNGQFVLLSDANYMKQVFEDPAFNSRTSVGYIGACYAIAAGFDDGRLFYGLNNDNSPYWKIKRDFVDKFIVPTYAKNIGLFNEYAAKLVENLKAKSHGHAKFEVEALPILRRWGFELMGEIIFGKEAFNRKAELKEGFFEGTNYFLENFGKFEPFSYPFTNIIAWFMSIGLDKKMKEVHAFLAEVLRHKKEVGFGDDWLSYLATNTLDGHHLTDQDIMVMCFDLLLGNFGPGPFVIDYGMYALGKFGYVMEKVRLEHKKVIGEDRQTLTLVDIHKLPYLHGTTMEMLRIYPAGGGIGGRLCNKDNTNFHGYGIPVDTGVLYNTYAIHRDERYWDEPNTVQPTRWNDGGPKQEYAFMTFGGGAKSCPGKDFVVLLSAVVFSYLIHAFDIEYHGEKEPEVEFALIARTKHTLKHKLVVIPRN